MGEFCIPKIQNKVVCKIGEKCFHDRHFTDECVPLINNNFHSTRLTGAGNSIPVVPIPADACVIAPPQVINRFERAVEQIDHNCISIEVSYTINVVLQSLSTGEVCIATIDVIDLPLNVPIVDVNTDPLQPVVLCKEPFYHEVFKKKPLNAYDARVVPSPSNPGFGRLVVRVEKVFIAVKYSKTALICESGCSVQECIPGFPPLPECPPFVAPTQCPEFCFTDQEISLSQCTDCPPVQITSEPPEVCLVPEVGAFEEIINECFDDSSIEGPRSFDVGMRTAGVVITVRRGSQTYTAITDSSQLARFPQLRFFIAGDMITARGKSITLPPGTKCCRVDFVTQKNRQGVIVRTLVYCDGRLIAILPN